MSLPGSHVPLSHLSDRDLWSLGGRLGSTRLQAERRFLACCVEISRRGLLSRRRGYASIFDYALRVGGVQPGVMGEVLGLADRLRLYPRLWELFASGAEGWSKLRVVAGHLAERDEAWWVEALTRSSKRTLEDLVEQLSGRLAARLARAAGPTAAAASGARSGGLAGDQVPGASESGAAGVGAASGGRGQASVAAEAAAGVEVPPPASKLPGEPAAAMAVNPLSPAFLVRAETHRAMVSARAGREFSLEEALGLALDACAPPPRGAAPVVPAPAVIPSRREGHVEVLVRIEETGELFRRSSAGWVPVPLVDRVLTLGEPLAVFRYGQAKAEALASAQASRGREIPAKVARFAWLRSAGACERPGCRGQGAHLHHRVRRAARVDHHPGRILVLCAPCHGALHAGLLEESEDVGRDLRFRLPGEALASGPIDRRVQQERTRARQRP